MNISGSKPTSGSRLGRWKIPLLVFFSALAIGAAVGIGAICHVTASLLDSNGAVWVRLVGELFQRAASFVVAPLLVASIVVATSAMRWTMTLKVAVVIVVYSLVANFIAALIGLVLVVAIRPGASAYPIDISPGVGASGPRVSGVVLDVLRNAIPDNFVEVAFGQHRTKWRQERGFNGTVERKEEVFERGVNVLGLIVVSHIVGVAIGCCSVGGGAGGRVGGVFGRGTSGGKSLIALFKHLCLSVLHVAMTLAHALSWVAPFAIFFLLLGHILLVRDFEALSSVLGWYIGTVAIGLGIYGLVVLPAILFGLLRSKAFGYGLRLLHPAFTAIGTGSSYATLPITMSSLIDSDAVSPGAVLLALPVGAALNLNGTSLFLVVAVGFIAQMNAIQLSPGQWVTVLFSAPLWTTLSAGIPSAGLTSMMLMLSCVGLPTESISVIVVVDWILNRLRTAVNVMSDGVVVVLVDKIAVGDNDENDEEDWNKDESGPNDTDIAFDRL